jgi:hypothetical protein
MEAAQWLVDESPRKRTWEEAIDYCDWKGGRLPSVSELKSAYNNPIKEAFKRDFYWSSSENSNDFDQAFYLNFHDGASFYSPKTFKMQVRCVKR